MNRPSSRTPPSSEVYLLTGSSIPPSSAVGVPNATPLKTTLAPPPPTPGTSHPPPMVESIKDGTSMIFVTPNESRSGGNLGDNLLNAIKQGKRLKQVVPQADSRPAVVEEQGGLWGALAKAVTSRKAHIKGSVGVPNATPPKTIPAPPPPTSGTSPPPPMVESIKNGNSLWNVTPNESRSGGNLGDNPLNAIKQGKRLKQVEPQADSRPGVVEEQGGLWEDFAKAVTSRRAQIKGSDDSDDIDDDDDSWDD